MANVSIGDQAPDFSLPNQKGNIISLSSYRGKSPVVVYFYPKNETPGCTAEACGFRDSYEDFVAEGAEVIGISADSQKSHAAFASNRQLPFQLCSDRDHQVSKQYGVKGGMFGLMPGRETFVIDRNGTIRHRFSSQMQIDRHISEALEVVKELNKVAG